MGKYLRGVWEEEFVEAISIDEKRTMTKVERWIPTPHILSAADPTCPYVTLVCDPLKNKITLTGESARAMQTVQLM
ncbi:hypothetical protein QW71_11085 [Paenibacillus sp. IHB B 3415]|nr:hypothetical protein QW71_11085 [Paenibacillus sp. IHB B 3415]